MRYGDVARLCVPVAMPPRTPQSLPTPPPPDPDAGARWGRPSEFSWSLDGARSRRKGGSITVDLPDPEPRDYMRVIDAELKVMSERVKVSDPADPETWVGIDRLTRMAFHYTEFPPKPDPASRQPSLTTYYDLEFALHPPASEEAP